MPLTEHIAIDRLESQKKKEINNKIVLVRLSLVCIDLVRKTQMMVVITADLVYGI